MRDEGSVTSGGTRWRAAFLIAFTLLQTLKCVVAARVAPFVDEAFYWQESRHLAWGYSDLPPLTAWLIRAGETLAGHGLLGMRWPFLLLGATLPWMVVLLARRLFDARIGWQAGLWCLVLPLAGSMGVLALPDVPLTAAILLACLALQAALSRDRWRDWLLLGAALALAWMTHYRAAMAMLAGLAFMLITSRGRAQWRRPGLWLALGVAALGLIPLILSNLHQDGAGLEFQLVQRNPWHFHADALVQPIEQALVCTPLLYLLLLWAWWKSVRRARSGACDWDLIAVVAGTFLVAYFVFGLFADDTRFRVHWPLPGYLPLLAVLPALLAGIRGWRRVYVHAAAWLAAVLQGALLTWLMLASFPGGVAWLHGVKAFPANFVGWDRSAAAVKRLLPTMPPDTVLVADNFKLASELDFQLDGVRPIYVLDSPLNVKHGRSPQIRIWQLDEASLRHRFAGAPMLLALEESALSPRNQPRVLGQMCRRILAPRLLEAFHMDGGRKRFAFYLGTVPAQLGPVRPRDDCTIWRHAYRIREATRDAKQP
ncbi:glycosyltransferase family 39 protein [Oleiagrimonas soli]|uniref:4-amino-4-deoxy-L-arabinose transferase-like glycosyltransferase n=1 Tax=Oleiagrimonas soli TaxID=1543381 RepID=A0A841KIM3_9GAMM|nr:glycosyltransferase family 39 protein [Oleiagrimonas soli]MBB6183619.1 4-amino-4-deoxy-L-arabinose transferase-like glycosyltransferase [Oleiagrimonas soli]